MSTFASGEPASALPEVRSIVTRAGPMEVALLGAGPAAIALHGAMGGWDQGILLARSVGAAGLRWLAPSRPGFLGTPRGLGSTPEEQADRYAEVLDGLGIEDAAVVAVSGGGPSAIAFALRHPRRCRALVLVSACTVGRIDVRLPLAWHLMKLAARLPPLVSAMRRKAARDPMEAARRSIPDPALRERTVRDPEAGPLMAALQLSTLDRMALRIPGTEDDIATSRSALGAGLESMTVPALAVHGTADRAAPFAQAEAIAARVPGAELLALEGGEHVALFTHLAEVRARVGPFLRRPAPRLVTPPARTPAGARSPPPPAGT